METNDRVYTLKECEAADCKEKATRHYKRFDIEYVANTSREIIHEELFLCRHHAWKITGQGYTSQDVARWREANRPMF